MRIRINESNKKNIKMTENTNYPDVHLIAGVKNEITNTINDFKNNNANNIDKRTSDLLDALRDELKSNVVEIIFLLYN